MRLDSETSTFSMILRARTRPTPGSDSRTVETFILPTMSSLVRSKSSLKDVLPFLSCSLSSALLRLATAAFSSAWRLCSSVRGGGSGIGTSSFGLAGGGCLLRPRPPFRRQCPRQERIIGGGGVPSQSARQGFSPLEGG